MFKPLSAVVLIILTGMVLGLSVVHAQEEITGVQTPEPPPVEELVPMLPTVPVSRGPAGPNVTIIDATPLPRDKAPQLDYEAQTANFRIGETITGATSGATGTIVADNDRGTEGTLTLTDVEGEFEPGEEIADETGGAASVAKPLREGIWVLDFAFKPLRMRNVEIPGRGLRDVLYLYYRVVNHTGKPRMFVPRFELVNDKGKRYTDMVVPAAVPVIQARENPSVELLGAVQSTGMVPPSTKEGVDDAVFGVAVWVVDQDLRNSNTLTVYIKGLSDGFQEFDDDESEETQVRHKTLKIEFAVPGDARNFRERAIRLLDPPYQWIYD